MPGHSKCSAGSLGTCMSSGLHCSLCSGQAVVARVAQCCLSIPRSIGVTADCYDHVACFAAAGRTVMSCHTTRRLLGLVLPTSLVPCSAATPPQAASAGVQSTTAQVSREMNLCMLMSGLMPCCIRFAAYFCCVTVKLPVVVQRREATVAAALMQVSCTTSATHPYVGSSGLAMCQKCA